MNFPVISHKLDQYSQIRYAVSTKKFGNLSFQHPFLPIKQTITNRKNFFAFFEIVPKKVINVALRHRTRILWATQYNQGQGALTKASLPSFYDGLATNQKNVFLMITVADCFPVLFFDPIREGIGILHAGWRGVLRNIPQKMIKLLQTKVSSNPKDIIAFIGPGLSECHFQVQNDVFFPFLKRFGKKVAFRSKGKLWLNIRLAIIEQLKEAGLRKNNIESSPLCTYCEEDLFSSFRRDKNLYTAQGAVIGLV